MKITEDDYQQLLRDHSKKLPFSILLLRTLCIFSFVFFGIIALLCLVGLFQSGWIAEVIGNYLPQKSYSHEKIILITTIGFILHAAAFFGLTKMWSGRKKGYIIFSIATLLITLIFLFSNKVSVLTTGVYISLVLVFGLFYRRFH